MEKAGSKSQREPLLFLKKNGSINMAGSGRPCSQLPAALNGMICREMQEASEKLTLPSVH